MGIKDEGLKMKDLCGCFEARNRSQETILIAIGKDWVFKNTER